MKKLFVGFFAIATMALVGCSQEEQLMVMNDTNETYTGVMEVSESRTSLGEDGSVIWSAEDAISIFKKSGYHQKYQVKEGGSTVATFKYAGESEEHGVDLGMNYAVYPYSADHSIDAQGEFTLDLSSLSNQTYAERTFENGKSVMIAKSDNNDLVFFNTLSILRVKLCSEVPGEYSINSITLTSASKALNGTATIDMSQDKQPAVFETNGNKMTTLTCSEAVMLKDECTYDEDDKKYIGGHDFYILVPAETYPAGDLTIKVEGEDLNGKAIVYEAQYPEELVLKRSEITTIHHAFAEEDWRGSIEGEYNEASGLYWNGDAAAHKSVYYIYNASDLQKAASYFAGQNHSNEGNVVTFELMGDIDMAGITWEPWSVMFVTLNANSHTISNLSNNLFGYAGAVTINNLTLENVISTGNQVGTFAACAEGTTMLDCYLKGNNTITYVDANKDENGVGVITGICIQSNLNVTIGANSSVIVDKGTIVDTAKTTFEDLLYGYKHTTYTTNTGTITNNGNVLIGISTPEGLAALGGTKINGTYVLMAGLNMTGKEMKSMEISSGAMVNFIGNGHTISNLNLTAANIHGMTGSGNEVAGLFDLSAPATTVSLTVSDLTIKEATVSCSGYAAAVVGYNSNGNSVITLNNVDVDVATVTAESVAALVGYTTGKVNLTDCDVTGLSLTGEAGRPEKVGAYVGTANTTTCAITTANCTNNSTYGDYGRVINGATWNGATIVTAATQKALNSAVSSVGIVEVKLANGSYTMPTTNGDVTISGTKETFISGNDATAKNITFNGVTIQSVGTAYIGIKHSESVIYNDVDIVGNMYLYAEKVVFNNCNFDLSNTNDYIWVYGATNVEFKNCTFNTMGKAILVFQDGSKVDQTVKVEGCTFNASQAAYNWDKTIHIAAVSIDGSQGGTYNVILNGNTVDSDFNGLWQDKTNAGNITVTVNGTEVLKP